MSDRQLSRRDVMRAAGATAATAGIAGVGAAYSDTAKDITELSFKIHTGDSVGDPDQPFFNGVRDGLNDFASWLETWVGYVHNVYVSDLGRAYDVSLSGNGSDWEDPVRDAVPSTYQNPGQMNFVIIHGGSDYNLGRSTIDEKIYSSEGSVCYANNNHAELNRLTGYQYGYNTAIHEVAHCMGAVHSHGHPDMHGEGGKATIMATGYTNAANDWFDNNPPDEGCFGNSWTTYNTINLQPAFTRCTSHAVLDYLEGGTALDKSDFKTYSYIDENEKPF
ncbi:hypothetical protein [Salinilacihabitans rarus]|uniref:hypothetical protein n=1 Tax=Salinilacihabitans rarus TaxID=2961596 RepID=UPI0020C864A8|nr:hypothetical protein [Salinilacihabitans rarus]